MDDKQAVRLLFEKPLEPLFTQKESGKVSFDLPQDFYTDEFKAAAVPLAERFGETPVKIALSDTVQKPDLSFAKSLGMKGLFSLFNEKHKDIAGRLIQIFVDAGNLKEFLNVAAYTRDRVNPMLFQYALSVATQHRDDTKDVEIPTAVEIFPSNFVEPSVFRDARRQGSVLENTGDRTHVEIERNFTASDREEEQRLAYFREDIGVNMHHWHWHLVYPTRGPRNIIEKDRRGELFYYMHHQILARYNTERFCNHLPRMKILNNMREPLQEGYFPKILSSINNRTYPSRSVGTTIKDIDRPDNSVEVADLERWRDRVHEAIDKGFVINQSGNQIPLDEVRGIDLLGNIIEASDLSVNQRFYGNLHNMGHNLISFAHDPDGRFLEEFGVMGDVTTAMRDPIFYRWHGFIDSIFQKYKDSLPAYNKEQLGYEGISVDSVNVMITAQRNVKPNVLITYWQKSDVDLAAGLDFGPRGNVFAQFTHLQHAPFLYTINATNQSNVTRQGTCRIYLSPKSDERGTPLSFNERRQLMLEMDKFPVTLNPGENIIMRSSTGSNITIPFSRTFRKVGTEFQPQDLERLAEFQFCGCGWPHHLLLPRGMPNGMKFDLFVMISNIVDDMVNEPNQEQNICADATSFCGLRNKLYPDKRSMGYPFDRRHRFQTLEEFVADNTNMKMNEITIKFNDIIIDRQIQKA